MGADRNSELDKTDDLLPAEFRYQTMINLAYENTGMALRLVKLLDGVKKNPETLENEETRVLKEALATLPIDPNRTKLTAEQLELLQSIKLKYGKEDVDKAE